MATPGQGGQQQIRPPAKATFREVQNFREDFPAHAEISSPGRGVGSAAASHFARSLPRRCSCASPAYCSSPRCATAIACSRDEGFAQQVGRHRAAEQQCRRPPMAHAALPAITMTYQRLSASPGVCRASRPARCRRSGTARSRAATLRQVEQRRQRAGAEREQHGDAPLKMASAGWRGAETRMDVIMVVLLSG